MFRKLYGETEEDQLYYLSGKLKTSAIMAIAAVISVGIWFVLALLKVYAVSDLALVLASILYIVIIYKWGWGFMRAFLGVTTFGAILSNNIVWGILIFFLYIIVGAILGIANLFIGILRFIYLRTKFKQQIGEQ